MTRTVTIPGSDLAVLPICLGTALFGATINRDQSFKLLDAFSEASGNFIDTAHNYNDWIPGEKGRSEKTIGAWMKERNNRNRIVLATKGAHFHTMNVPRCSREEISYDVEESLSFMHTDRIDLYWLHRDDPSRPVAEIVDTMNRLFDEGKIRCYGVSNWRAARIREAIEYCTQTGVQAPVGNQMLWSLALPNREAWSDHTMVLMDDETRRLHEASGLAAIPYSSQANGFFSKLARPLGPWRLPRSIRRMYRNGQNLRRFKRIRKIARDTAQTIEQVVLGYLISMPFPTIPIVGCRTVEQLRQSMSASEVQFSMETIRFLENGQR